MGPRPPRLVRSDSSRLSNGDLVVLAGEGDGNVPPHLGAVLLSATGSTGGTDAWDQLIGGRLSSVPRLRQRVSEAGRTGGRPLWVDDRHFDPTRHVTVIGCPAPGDERALLDLAAAVCVRRLPRDRPLWSAVVVTHLAGGRTGLILVVHHVVVDGVGGLQVLESLFDRVGSPGPPVAAERRPPAASTTTGERAGAARRVLRPIPAPLIRALTGFRTAGGLCPPAASPCSLVGRTGRGRHLEVTGVDLDPVRGVAHALGCTVNDWVLLAVAESFRDFLLERGEAISTVRIAVMIAGRARPGVGNQVTPVVISVDQMEARSRRLHRVARDMRAAIAATRDDGAGAESVAAGVSLLLRLPALSALYRAYLRHQRRFHTIVSTVRGPAELRSIGGAVVESIVPLSTGEMGNTAVRFVVLSYANRLTITMITDPERVPQPQHLLLGIRDLLAPDRAVDRP